MISWTANFEELLNLLLSLPVSSFKILFEAETDMQLSGMEDQFRKKLLGRLKESWRFRQTCCPFINVPHKKCDACELSKTCLFRLLYDPKASVLQYPHRISGWYLSRVQRERVRQQVAQRMGTGF